VVERYARIRLRKQEVREGTFLAVSDGDVIRRERFRPDTGFVEDDPLPSVRAPQEAVSCLQRLAVLAAAA
jgi:hypothetical protein